MPTIFDTRGLDDDDDDDAMVAIVIVVLSYLLSCK
jgi:hypothetical protein